MWFAAKSGRLFQEYCRGHPHESGKIVCVIIHSSSRSSDSGSR